MNNLNILNDDINNVIFDQNIKWDNLRNKSVLITGATGIIGKSIAIVLGEINKRFYFKITIYAIGRNIEKGKALEKIDGVKFINTDIRNKIIINESIDYIIHCAAITESVKMLNAPVDVIETELNGGKNVLDLALLKKVSGMVYTSSMELYGILNLPEIFEKDLGYIDLTNPRNSYPQSKRMMESMCNCFYSQYSLPINIVRLGMTFGAGMDFINDKRVWAQFARCIYKHESIVLHTAGESLRSFVYISDAVKGIFIALLDKKYGETYNIASTYLKIKELAEKLANKFNLDVIINPPSDINKTGYMSELMLPLNSDKIKGIGWNPFIINVVDMFERTLISE